MWVLSIRIRVVFRMFVFFRIFDFEYSYRGIPLFERYGEAFSKPTFENPNSRNSNRRKKDHPYLNF